ARTKRCVPSAIRGADLHTAFQRAGDPAIAVGVRVALPAAHVLRDRPAVRTLPVHGRDRLNASRRLRDLVRVGVLVTATTTAAGIDDSNEPAAATTTATGIDDGGALASTGVHDRRAPAAGITNGR